MAAHQPSRSALTLGLLWPIPAVLLCSLSVVTLPEGSPLRLLGTGIALLFLPGYALTLAVFPGSRTLKDEVSSPLDRRYFESSISSLDPFERIALGVGFSVCLIPLYGYVVGLGVTGLAYEPRTIVLIPIATTLFVALAAIRYLLSPTDIDAPSPFARLAGVVAEEITAPTPGKRAMNVAVVVVLVLATANLAVAVASPGESPEYTTAALLTENDEGELVADGYPDQLRAGETADLVLRVENHESRAVDYEVVVQLQRVGAGGTVTEISTRDRFEQTVDAGSVWEQDHRVASDMSGERVRLAYLIYKGDPPTEPTLNNSYRNLTLWVGSEQPTTGDGTTDSDDTTAGNETTAGGDTTVGDNATAEFASAPRPSVGAGAL